MTIANTFAAKASVAFVAIAMALMMVAPAQAQTAEELQAQIDTLMATIASLQGGTTATASADAYVFTRALTIGSQGADVTALQNYLIGAGFSIPAGATGYFGAQTQAAVAAWQTANGVMPAAGYFGPVSQAKYTALVAATPSTGDDEDEDEDDSDSDSTDLQGEASLDDVTVENGDDDEIEEGQEAAPVADINVEFTDGDAEITRLDISLVSAGGGTDDEQDPWDTFDEVSLWVDGDEVATMDASDEDEYLDEDDGTLRFSGLDIVAMEDEELTITVAVTVQSSVDGVDDDEDWTLGAEAIRFVDADDVTSTEDSVGDLGGSNAEFTIGEEGGDDEIVVGSSTEDPEATTLILEDDSKSDYMTVFAFDLDTDDSTNDIEVNEIPVTIVTTATFGEVISDLQLVIDGEEYDDWEITTGTTGSTTVVVTFETDGDLVIEAGEEVTAELQVEFKALDVSDEGTTVQGKVTTANAEAIDAEGADDLTAADDQLGGSATGDTHTLRSAGLIVDLGSIETETSTQGDNDTTGIFEISFDVTATEGDFYITDNASESQTDGVEFTVDGPAVATSTGVLASTADEDTTGVFTVREGETETFTLTVTVDAATSGQYRVTASELIYSTNANGTSSPSTQELEPVADYRTDYENINAN